MPELPEVETVKNVLAPQIIGRQILAVQVHLPKLIANLTPAQFAQRLTGQRIANFTRRGKFLTLHLANGGRAVLHLRMTGVLTVNQPADPLIKHTHLILTLDNHTELRFEDSRGFGKWWYFALDQPDSSGVEQLGPEPENLTLAHLTQICAKHHAPLKSVLLDQHQIAGIGNIYGDEICFQAGILPLRPAQSLTADELKRLHAAIQSVIAAFIKHHQTDAQTYANAHGRSYQTDQWLAVYGQAGKPCPRCHLPLTGARVGQRSTVFCPRCQK